MMDCLHYPSLESNIFNKIESSYCSQILISRVTKSKHRLDCTVRFTIKMEKVFRIVCHNNK